MTRKEENNKKGSKRRGRKKMTRKEENNKEGRK